MVVVPPTIKREFKEVSAKTVTKPVCTVEPPTNKLAFKEVSAPTNNREFKDTSDNTFN